MERDGIAPPVELTQTVSLRANLIGYLDAFYDLDTERHHGETLMRIPWSSIMAYADRYGMPEDETNYFIRRMDDAHLKKLAEERKRRSTNGPDASRPSQVVRRPPRPD